MNTSGPDPRNQYAARQIEKHLLPALHESHKDANDAFLKNQYTDNQCYGYLVYQNRLNRMREAARGDNPFEIVNNEGSSYDLVGLRHPDHGLIILYAHNVDASEYVPRSDQANMIQQNATRPGQNELFLLNKEVVHHRLLGVVSAAGSGLEDAVVGELYKTKYPRQGLRLGNIERIDLTQYTPPGVAVPEPEATPKVTITKPSEVETA